MKRSYSIVGLVLLASIGYTQPAIAQVSADGTVGTIVSTVPLFNITGGTRPSNGPNLFHSFSQFSLPTGSSAIFQNDPAVQTIFSRVTGGSRSDINGTIQTQGNASLFLMNPNGIVFGPNAKLQLGGSFVGTTASSIKFEDGIEFSAVNLTANPVLTVNLPIGLQMGTNPGAIVNSLNGSESGAYLQTKKGQTLALIGGDISLKGSFLNASDGHLALGSVGSNSLVKMTPTSSGWAFNYQGVQQFQDIQLAQKTSLYGDGQFGSSIQVQGRRISLTGQSEINNITFGTKNAKPISIHASESIEFIDSTLSNVIAKSYPGDYSRVLGGNINLEAPLIRLQSSGISTYGEGNSGNVIIKGNMLELLGSPGKPDLSSTITTTSFTGKPGDIRIDVQHLRVVDGSTITSSTDNEYNSGNIIINSAKSVELSGITTQVDDSSGEKTIEQESGGIFTNTYSSARGNAGHIVINTGQLSILKGASISTMTKGDGNAGNITIHANSVEVADPFVDRFGVVSGIVLSVDKSSKSQGGKLNIETNSLNVFNGGQIIVSTDGKGHAGSIDIRAGVINLSGTSTDGQFRSSISARSSTNFSAGEINLTSDRLAMNNRAEITASNTSTGDAGTLNLRTGTLSLDQGSQIRANVNGGNQGNLILHAQNLLLLRNGSTIVTNATGFSTGGNITIDSPVIVGLENSDIIANAVRGKGGNIRINTQGIFGLKYRDRLTPENDITASSEFGINGNVEVKIIGINPDNALNALPSEVTDVSRQIADRCSATKNSSFIVTGRGGIPNHPLQRLRTNRTWHDLRPVNVSNLTTVRPIVNDNAINPIVEASAIEVDATGSIALVAPQSIPPNPGTCVRLATNP